MEGPDTMVEKIGNRQRGGGAETGAPVTYTHLTLPTTEAV